MQVVHPHVQGCIQHITLSDTLNLSHTLIQTDPHSSSHYIDNYRIWAQTSAECFITQQDSSLCFQSYRATKITQPFYATVNLITLNWKMIKAKQNKNDLFCFALVLLAHSLLLVKEKWEGRCEKLLCIQFMKWLIHNNSRSLNDSLRCWFNILTQLNWPGPTIADSTTYTAKSWATVGHRCSTMAQQWPSTWQPRT